MCKKGIYIVFAAIFQFILHMVFDINIFMEFLKTNVHYTQITFLILLKDSCTNMPSNLPRNTFAFFFTM